jgi:hypothetical protein
MPVTLTPTENRPRKWPGQKISTAENLLELSCPKNHRTSKTLIQQSFSPRLFETNYISASSHGFVWAVFNAYSDHHELIVRPDDVWLSILSQLNFYINGHAEDLRDKFVSHQGQRELEVISAGTARSADFGALSLRMTELVQKNVLDEELRSWIMPTFTTTAESDRVVAATLMMGALQKYFTFKNGFLCGIPKVTLLGKREDWELMGTKLDKLLQLSDETNVFAQLLRPVLSYFVASFDNPAAPDVISFWNRCARRNTCVSGSDELTGWLSVFCLWSDEGEQLGLHGRPIRPVSLEEFQSPETRYNLDNVFSCRVDIDKIPSGFASVPIKINDNGHEYDAAMLAGIVGIQAKFTGADVEDDASGNAAAIEESTMRNTEVSDRTERNVIQPLSGWWIYETESQKEAEARELEAQRLRDELLSCAQSRTKERMHELNREFYLLVGEALLS